MRILAIETLAHDHRRGRIAGLHDLHCRRTCSFAIIGANLLACAIIVAAELLVRATLVAVELLVHDRLRDRT